MHETSCIPIWNFSIIRASNLSFDWLILRRWGLSTYMCCAPALFSFETNICEAYIELWDANECGFCIVDDENIGKIE